MNNSTDNYVVYNPVIENIIEITYVYTCLCALDNRISISDDTMKYKIVDWANEFEDKMGGIDSDSMHEDYVKLIHDFAVRKTLIMIGLEDEEILPYMETHWVWWF